MRHKIFIAMLAPLAFSACAIKQNVQPVSLAQASEMCVITNPKVKVEFLTATLSSLKDLGYTTKELPADARLADCDNVLTYTANWNWDVAVYMTYAKFSVYNNGDKTGEAEYDSRRGGANMSKFIQAESKVKELITQLFIK